MADVLFTTFRLATLCSGCIMENGSHNSLQIDGPLTMPIKKGDMWEWLSKERLKPPDDLTKCELLEIVKEIGNVSDSKYSVDEIAFKNDYQIFWLPLYSFHYNAINLIWVQVKNYVASQYNFKWKSLKVLLHDALESGATENWIKGGFTLDQIWATSHSQHTIPNKQQGSFPSHLSFVCCWTWAT